jgi:hypothetical protein
VRGQAKVTWTFCLQPTPPGWLDLALSFPIMDATRVREEVGWPRYRSTEALGELLDGVRLGDGGPTPPLDAAAAAPLRLWELKPAWARPRSASARLRPQQATSRVTLPPEHGTRSRSQPVHPRGPVRSSSRSQ